MEKRLGELGQESDQELMKEDHELQRESRWLASHRVLSPPPAPGRAPPGVVMYHAAFLLNPKEVLLMCTPRRGARCFLLLLLSFTLAFYLQLLLNQLALAS